jgi:hypothetical protein
LSDLPVFEENFTSAAIDGVRISAAVAGVLVSLDSRLADDQRAAILEALDQARNWLDAARAALPVPATSVHVVRASAGGLIVP